MNAATWHRKKRKSCFYSFNILFHLLVIFSALLWTYSAEAHSNHQHSHEHSDEPPHLKYTREVNEAAKHSKEDLHAHSHGHGHVHETGGGGGCHGHSHDDFDDEHTHSHSHLHNELPATAKKSPKTQQGAKPSSPTWSEFGPLSFMNDAHTRLWVYSLGATLLISAFPFFILGVIPIQGNTGEDSPLLKVLLAFGAGGLLGDAFLHLIPHATPGHSHSHTHSHTHSHSSGVDQGEEGHSHDMSVGGWVLTGFFVFFIVEKFVRILRGEDGHGHSHGHHHHAEPAVKKKAKHSDTDEEPSTQSEELSEGSGKGAARKKGEATKLTKAKKPATKKGSSQEVDEASFAGSHHTSIRVAAYLNFVADIMHNFTDGLAIGASFIAGPTVGFVTMLTVLVHEIPHEIGDFAILVQSGCSKRKAMMTQLITAIGALAGCVVSLWSVDAYAMAEAAEQSWVLPFTAGGFIYIATVSVVPELLERSTFWQSVAEVAAGLFGVGMMYLIALYE